MTALNIFWFRRDLRLEDNHALYEALNADLPVLPIFIFDTNILENLPKNDARVTFIHRQITKINRELTAIGTSLKVFYGNPIDVYKELLGKYHIHTLFANRDYEPYGIARDTEIYDYLKTKDITFKGYKDHVIFEKNEITKDNGDPYKVYTPYSKKWIKCFESKVIENYPSEDFMDNFYKTQENNFCTLQDIGFEPSQIDIPEYNVSEDLITNYEDNRNIPGIKGTSKLGHHLRFGTVSVRKMAKKAASVDNNTFLKELIWREFFMQILWHYPETIHKAFKSKYDAILWRNNKEDFQKWCTGTTGYPLVDAGMRELNQTGFMHNRVRMLVGSFLCKHLLIDWRWGEAYFAKKLLDFELSSNVGNWQWVSGSGVDAAPYFRIFNPTTQIQKFDKEYRYIKKWVPEYNDDNYVQPMVDHKYARERCLDAYKKAVK